MMAQLKYSCRRLAAALSIERAHQDYPIVFRIFARALARTLAERMAMRLTQSPNGIRRARRPC